MKINAKLFILTLSIITLVSVSSAYIYNKLAQQLIQKQNSRTLINSANDFIFAFQQLIQKVDESYQSYKNDQDIFNYGLDFVFELQKDSTIIKSSLELSNDTYIYKDVNKLNEFIAYNSNLLIRQDLSIKKNIYYGIQINSEILKDLSEKIRADIALVEDNVISNYTNSELYNYYLPNLSTVAREFKDKNNFEIIYNDLGGIDFTATHFLPKISDISNKKIDFIIFNISSEAADFATTMSLVTLVIVISSILLTIVFLFLFTTKFRKQLDYISEGVETITAGNRNKRVKIVSKDEIGSLGNALNNMLEELDKRDKEEKEYSEFISIINQNPSLEEIGNATLKKIINSTGADVGAFYHHDNDEFTPIAVVGLINKKQDLFVESGIYEKAREEKKVIELTFSENQPIVKTGLTEFRINHLYILPIFYNNRLIAVMELASVNKPKINVKEYLIKIKDQLAIGLANGKALTDLKKMIDELKKLNNAYQQQNIEITEKNTELLKLHDKLKRGTKELEIQTAKAVESEKVKSQFLAAMSHELRTPQNSILGLTELILKDETTTPKTRERLNVVLRNGKKLLTLIENILEYSKLESGNKEIKKSSITLTELIDEVYSFIYPLFIETQIDFKINIPKKYNYELYTDVKKIEQIMYNLIGNAIKFTSKGFVKLEIKVEEDLLKIIVEDTGTGIAEDDQKIIFDEFRQADGELNRKFSGTGLGLAICKKYSELLNGSIQLESSIDKGTRFIVEIPGAIQSKIENKIAGKEPDGLAADVKALIISDGKDSKKLIKDYLVSNNINVEVISSDEIDLKVIAQLNFSTIILDILLKPENGWNILFDIKTHSALKLIPLVVVNMDEEANCGLGLKVYDYHIENFEAQKILNAINNFTEDRKLVLNKIHLVTSAEKIDKINSELNNKFSQITYSDNLEDSLIKIKEVEPDVILFDMLNKKINPFDFITELNYDIYIKDIPIITFINSDNGEETKFLNNQIFETTLLKQHHPLDVLKVIKDRIEIFNNKIFDNRDVEEISHELVTTKTNDERNFDKIKILIVDDNSDARFTIGEIIKSLDFEPLYAKNGNDCLEKLEKEIPDLILLDIMMPVMDGFQTIKKIREKMEYQKIKVYALTAYAMLSDREIIEKNGFDGLFTKPINTLQLEKKLNNIFKASI